jgi:hypothetical protein
VRSPLLLVTGLSVTDVPENAMANLAWDDIRLPNPVFAGEHPVERVRDPRVGVAPLCRHRADPLTRINQRTEVVIEFRRTVMVYKRSAEQVQDMFPITDAEWAVQRRSECGRAP